MAYVKNIYKSKLMQDEHMNKLMKKILLLEPGESIGSLHTTKYNAKRLQDRLYVLLNGMGKKKQFIIHKPIKTKHESWLVKVSKVKLDNAEEPGIMLFGD